MPSTRHTPCPIIVKGTMSKQKKRVRMPRWIWSLKRRVLNAAEKRFLSYIWWCANRGCRDWNYQLARRFDVTDRTIRRWISHLERGHLISIQFRHGKHRTIYRLPYFKQSVWNNQRRILREQEAYAAAHPNRFKPGH